MKHLFIICLVGLFLFSCTKQEPGSIITGHLQFEGAAPTDTVYIGVYSLGAARYLGGYENLQKTMAAEFKMPVEPGLYTLAIYSYEFELFRTDFLIPDEKTSLNLEINLPRLGIPDSVKEVVFHGGNQPGSMNWRESQVMEKDGHVWRLKDASVIQPGEKYQIWVDSKVLWNLKEKNHTVIHGWTTINNLYSGGEIVFDPSLYRQPEKLATSEMKGKVQDDDLKNFAAALNLTNSQVRNYYHQIPELTAFQRDSIYELANQQFNSLELKYPEVIKPYIVEQRINSIDILHPVYYELRQLWRKSNGDSLKLAAFYASPKFKDFISNKIAQIKLLDPKSYLIKGWFAHNAIYLDEILKAAPDVRKELKISDSWFYDFLINFVNQTPNKKCAGTILYSVGLNYSRSEEPAKRAKAIDILTRLKNEFPNDGNVKEGYVDNLLQSLKVVAGVAAPDFSITTLTGEKIRLSALKGKFVFLDFWGSWCGPCRIEIPNIKKLAAAVSEDKLLVLGLAYDDSTNLVNYIQTEGIDYRNALADKNLVRLYGISGYPTTVLIGPDQKIIAKELRGEKLTELVKDKMKQFYLSNAEK